MPRRSLLAITCSLSVWTMRDFPMSCFAAEQYHLARPLCRLLPAAPQYCELLLAAHQRRLQPATDRNVKAALRRAGADDAIHPDRIWRCP